jgi:YcxB-like protein
VNILARYTLTPSEALRGARTFQRSRYAVSVGSGLLLVLLGTASLLAPQGERALGAFMIFNGLLFAVLPEAVLRWARLRRGARACTPMEVELDEEGLTLRAESGEGGLPWTAFAAIRRHGGFWIFRMSRSRALLIPERALEGATGAELERFLRERKLMKG